LFPGKQTVFAMLSLPRDELACAARTVTTNRWFGIKIVKHPHKRQVALCG
jgi:hypothetical protein